MSLEIMPTPEAIIREEHLKKVTFWSSRFNFLNVTNGIRPARMSYLMGTTGTGKTTLLAGVIADASRDSKVLVIVSEESIIRYANKILKSSHLANKENIKFLHEKMIPEEVRSDQKLILAWLEMHIIESGVRLVFWDNLTDSPIFSLQFGPAGQEWAVMKIRELCERLEVAFFIVIHTKKGVEDNSDKLISGEDVRGTQQTFIGADFFYIFQRFTIGENHFPFVRIVKHRDTDPRDKLFLLGFSNSVYVKDAPCSFEEINEIFLKRNRLGKSKSKGTNNDRF